MTVSLTKNWFATLNDALDSEGLLDLWPVGGTLNYGDTKGLAKDGKWLSVYRDNAGRYERPVHYATQMADSCLIHLS